jgi:nucleoside-diphosphate-sugar epimerase
MYNLSKLMGESLCLSAAQGRARVARLSNVIGLGDANSGNFVSSLVNDAKAGKITLRSHPDSAKDYIHVDDVALLLPRIATEGRAPVYNIASGVKIPHRDWTTRLANLTGCAVELTESAPFQDFPDIDIAPLRREFDFQPRPVLDLLPELLKHSQNRHGSHRPV